MAEHLVIDIETVPINQEGYAALTEEDKKKLMNPIDSRIIAIGIRYRGEDTLFLGEDEKALLVEFWKRFAALRVGGTEIVGFNLINFDIPFLVTRSFIHVVKIVPFTVKYLVDLREKVSAYRSGHSRGTLKDFARAMGLPVLDVDGSNMAELWTTKQIDKIKEYLKNDLQITDAMYARMRETNILQISRW